VYPWDEDDPAIRQRIEANLSSLLSDVLASALNRESYRVDLAREWHKRTLKGIPVHEADVVGNFRGEGRPESKLRTYQNQVRSRGGGFLLTTSPGQVTEQLAALEARLSTDLQTLDAANEAGTTLQPAEELSVLDAAAVAHGEWVRIHPFADGNGRTARLWANWILLRYGLPPVVRLRPRPTGVSGPAGNRYEVAAELSLSGGNHRLMRKFLIEELAEYRQRNP
jgi:fido (protein-threonine AMPylation protein)